MSVLARNASSRLRARYVASSLSRTYSISVRIRARRDGCEAVPSSSARGRSGTRPASASMSTTASTTRGRHASAESRRGGGSSWRESADAALVSGAKVRGSKRIDRRLAIRPRRRRLAIWRNARASAGVLYPCRERRCSRSRGDVMEQLFRRHQQVVEPVNFRRGVRQPSTPTHHRVKTVAMVGVEREEQRDDRVPRVGS